MLRHPAYIKLVVPFEFVAVMLTASSGFGQEVVVHKAENKVAVDETKPKNDLESEVTNLKAENAAVREQLRKMEEQQKALLDQFERLQRRLDSAATAVVQPDGAAKVADASVPLTNPANAPATDAGNAPAPQPPVAQQQKEDHYQDGIVIWQNDDDAKVPFLLKFNNNTQVRYLNTLDSEQTFTDHLGVVREVHKRNDVTVNRSMFTLTGYMFSKKLQYALTVWTSAGAASIVVAGNIGWRFNKALTITGGYTGVPGSRSLVNTFPFFQPTDREHGRQLLPSRLHAGSLGKWRTIEGAELFGLRRQRSQYTEYHGK